MFSFTQEKLPFNEDTRIQKAIFRKNMVNINPTLGFEEPLGPLFPKGSKASSFVLSVPPKEAKGSTLPKGSPWIRGYHFFKNDRNMLMLQDYRNILHFFLLFQI